MLLQKLRLEAKFTAQGSVGGVCLRLRSDPDLSQPGGAPLSAKPLSAVSPLEPLTAQDWAGRRHFFWVRDRAGVSQAPSSYVESGPGSISFLLASFWLALDLSLPVKVRRPEGGGDLILGRDFMGLRSWAFGRCYRRSLGCNCQTPCFSCI